MEGGGNLPNFDEIVLESPEFNFEYLRELPHYQEKRYSDALFMGQLVNGKRNGKGVMRYKSGRQYEGQWENDMRNGRGFERYPNSNSYFGFFKNGKAHGKGVYTWNNGEVYDGEWD